MCRSVTAATAPSTNPRWSSVNLASKFERTNKIERQRQRVLVAGRRIEISRPLAYAWPPDCCCGISPLARAPEPVPSRRSHRLGPFGIPESLVCDQASPASVLRSPPGSATIGPLNFRDPETAQIRLPASRPWTQTVTSRAVSDRCSTGRQGRAGLSEPVPKRSGRPRALQSANILLVQANRRRNLPRHKLTL